MSPKHRMVAGFFTEMDFERVPKVCNSFSTTDALWKVFSQFWPLVFWISGSRQAFGLLFFVCWFFHLKSERRVQGRLPRMNCHTHWCRLPDVSDRWTWLRRVRVEQGRRQPLSSPCWVGWMSVRTTLRSVTPGWGSCLPACPCLSVCLALGHCVSVPVCLLVTICLALSVSRHPSAPVSPCLYFDPCICHTLSVFLPLCLTICLYLSAPVCLCCSVSGCICYTLPACLPMYDRQLYAAAPGSSFAVVIYGGPLFWDHEPKNQPKNGL